MAVEELCGTLLELLRSVIRGAGGALRMIGDIIIDGADVTAPLPANSLKLFSNVAANRAAFIMIAAYAVFINIFTFIKFSRDKEKAARKEFRESERNLMLLCAAGGAAGGMLGMRTARHKTNKRKFAVWVPILMAAQTVLYCFALGFLGFWAFF